MDEDAAFDEWQWPASCESMRQLESHLRCQICGDFFHGPVLLPCSHAFCSECVRRFLQTKGASGYCPECKQPCAPRDLVANRPLERVVLLFQEAKPQLLGQLGQSDGQLAPAVAEPAAAAASSSARSTRATASLMLARRSGGKPAERMALVSYSVMKDKEVRKLLDAIGVRVPTKNREEIIQIHKEYVLLANAQADSCNPKTAAELRDQVVRNYHLRVQEKARQAELSKRGGANTETPAAGVSSQMAQNFAKLAQDIADRKAGKQPASASAASTPSPMTPGKGKNTKSPVGIWRHIYAMDTKQEFYINSVTREIRLQPPSPRIQQQSPANRYDGITEPVVDAVSSSDAIAGATPETPGVILEREGKLFRSTPSKKLPHARVKRAIADDFFSPGSSSAGESGSPHTRSRLSVSSAASVATTATTVIEEGDTRVTTTTTTTTSAAAAAAVVDVSEDGDIVGGDTPETAISVHGEEDAHAGSSNSAAAAGDADDDEGKKWGCPRCTLVNDPSCANCEACGYENTALQPPRKRQRKKLQFQSKLSLR